MITINGTDYRLCMLDTNAVSELVKRQAVFAHFLEWSLVAAPIFVPCFSVFTLLELRRNAEVYQLFIERFSILPCLLLKSHEQLLEEETRYYPHHTVIDPCLIAFAGPLGKEGSHLATALETSFRAKAVLDQERRWNDSQDEIVNGIQSLVANFPPAGDSYTSNELRRFLQMGGSAQLVYRAHDFARVMVESEIAVDIDAFPSLKASLYTVFYKFYADRSRRPSRSDAFDIIISAATPYVDAIITENHQAESLRKMKRRDSFIRDLHIFTLRDFRQAPPSRMPRPS